MMWNFTFPNMGKACIVLSVAFSTSLLSPRSFAQLTNWQYISASDGSKPSAREECSYVEAAGKFYLIGGRGSLPVDVYDPVTNRWSHAAPIPGDKELNHFQPVTYQGKIYIIGAFTGNFPSETPVGDIYIYDPSSNSWTVLSNAIPSSRRRGSAGAVVYQNKIYIVGGIRNGHTDGWVNWLDVFDPATRSWTPLSDAPHARDHFQAAVINGNIYAAAGRRTGYNGSYVGATEATVDVYNIAADDWETLPASGNIPTQRAGTATVVMNNMLLVMGGESNQLDAHRQVEAYDPNAGTWKSLTQLNIGRNGTGAILYNNRVYTAAGAAQQYGGNIQSTQEFATNNGAQAVLPIKLGLFDAVAGTAAVTVKWTTETENGYETFTVERSRDGLQFEPVQNVVGKGSGANAYSFVDQQPLSDRSYYRLKWTDAGGGFYYSDVKSVLFREKKGNGFTIYPNPVNTGVIYVLADGPIRGRSVKVELRNMGGALIMQQNVQTNNTNRLTINLTQKPSRGTYVVSFTDDEKTISKILYVE